MRALFVVLVSSTALAQIAMPGGTGGPILGPSYTANGAAPQFVCDSTTERCTLTSEMDGATGTVPVFELVGVGTVDANDRLHCISHGTVGSPTRVWCVDKEGDVSTGGTYSSSVASGSNAFEVVTAGGRVRVGPASNSYFHEQSSTIHTPSVLKAQAFRGEDSSGYAFLQGAVANGATANATRIGNTNALSTAGADILELFSDNISTLQARIDKDGFFISEPHAVTIVDTGDANPATLTLTPTSETVRITCNDAHTCDITMGETGVQDGARFCATNVSTNTVDWADSAGVSELAGVFAAGQWDTICMEYVTDRWVETNRSNN